MNRVGAKYSNGANLPRKNMKTTAKTMKKQPHTVKKPALKGQS